jgi:hypothetical protein
MSVDQPLAYRVELEAQCRAWHADAHLLEAWKQIRTERRWARTIEELVSEQEKASETLIRIEDARSAADEQQDVLEGDGPYADPARLYESTAISLLKELVPSTIVGSSELGLNYIVFESFNTTTFETWALAVTISVACIFGAHLIGIWTRKRRGTGGWRERTSRWILPVILSALLSLVQIMVAVLRGGFLDKPEVRAGRQFPPLLQQMHIPLWLVVVGWWALQAALTLYVASHVEETHNPHVRAHRVARRQLRSGSQRLAHSRSRIATLEITQMTLMRDLERIPFTFSEQRQAVDSLVDQSLAIYIRAMNRAKADPEFTAVAEQRLMRDFQGRKSPKAPPEPSGLHSVPPEPSGDERKQA